MSLFAGYMKLRERPLVLRFHKIKENLESHEYYYSENLLYLPWRNEKELFENDLAKCKNLYQRRSGFHGEVSDVHFVKQKLFPFKNIIQQAREYVELLGKAQDLLLFRKICPSKCNDNIDVDDDHVNL